MPQADLGMVRPAIVFRLLLGVMVLSASVPAKTLYVSPAGSDSNPGTRDSSFLSIGKGITTAVAGDTIYVREGTYAIAATTSISKSGTAIARYTLSGFPGEHPVLNYSTAGAGSRGINLSGSYWNIIGLDILQAPDNGLHVSGSNIRIERCVFRENGDTGLQLDGGASNDTIINCDSYFNVDASQGNADGYAAKLGVGTGIYFYGCRAWQNSDDGWDGYLRGADKVSSTIENSWVFLNGYLKDGNPSSGNGNGFKMGGSDNKDLEHDMLLIHCLAFDNRVKGFDQNNNRGSMLLYNCTGYRNGTNYSIPGPIDSGRVVEVKNCVALGAFGTLGGFAAQVTNSWMTPFAVDATDFLSIDTAGVRGPRQADGSLPDVPFMRLAVGSDLIDGGTDIGFPFNGSAPDLGCFESTGPTSVRGPSTYPGAFALEQNYPNPFNPTTSIEYTIAAVSGQPTAVSRVRLVVYDLLGREVAALVDETRTAGTYAVSFDAAGLAGGVYWYRLETAQSSIARKMILLR